MEKDKQEIKNYTISIRNELMKCYEIIYDLDREHRKSKNLVCKLVELLLSQILRLVKLNEIEKDIVKLEATKQIKDFLGSGIFL